jgi:aquaporin Z
MKKLLVEFIGTFLLLFTIGCAVVSGTVIPGLVIGSLLMVMVYAGGHISGAHYNPAVTLAIFLRGKIGAGLMLQYWVVQLLGGITGAMTAYFITGNNPDSIHHEHGATVSHFTALIAEIIGTFVLAYVVLNVATSKNTAGNSYYGLAIGFTVFAMAGSIGSISGCAINPAVGIGRNLSQMLFTGGDIAHFWIYIVGPFSGGALAAIIFNWLNPDDR